MKGVVAASSVRVGKAKIPEKMLQKQFEVNLYMKTNSNIPGYRAVQKIAESFLYLS